MRDRPKPLSMTSSGMDSPWRSSTRRTTAAPVSGVAGRRPPSAPRVSSSRRAMTLLLRLLIVRMISDSGGDSWTASGTASGGTMPARTWPVNVPPSSRHSKPEHLGGEIRLGQRQAVQIEFAAGAGDLAGQPQRDALLG